MSRLIDADVLINLLLTENQRCITSTGHELSVNMINSFIKKQPTAFNTEKVVEQLEKMKNNKDCHVYCYEFYKKKCMIYEKAIDIVKKGGVE